MNVTSNFKDRIQSYLNDKAQKDPLFAEELKKPNKNIDGCLAYICDTARKMAEKSDSRDGIGFDDGEGYIHSKFCYRKAESSKEFLKAHWDTERNMLKVEFIDEYYQLFRDERKNAIKDTLERLNHSEPIDTRREQDSAAQAKSASNNEPKKKEHKYIQLSLFD